MSDWLRRRSKNLFLHRGTRGDNNYQTNLAIRPVTKIAIVGATRFLCRGVRDCWERDRGPDPPGGVRLTPTGPPIGGGGAPAGGLPEPRRSRGPPELVKFDVFGGTPPKPGFDPRNPRNLVKFPIPGFYLCRGGPPGEGGYPPGGGGNPAKLGGRADFT